MKQAEKFLRKQMKKRWIAIVALILYVAFLAVYGYMSYAQDMLNIMAGYIGAAFVMALISF